MLTSHASSARVVRSFAMPGLFLVPPETAGRWHFRRRLPSMTFLGPLPYGLQPRDFGVHDKWFNLPVKTEVSSKPRAVEVRFLHALDFDFPNCVADPLCRLGFSRLERDLGGRLGEHDLRQVAINHLKLRLPLESKDKRISALPVLGNRGMELGQALQAGQFVEHKPDRRLVLLRRGQEAHSKYI